MALSYRRPPALKHGLFSQVARSDRSPQVTCLAEALAGECAEDPRVLEAARDAAEAILHLRHVEGMRHALLEDATLTRANRTDEERARARRLSSRVKGADASSCRALRAEVRASHDEVWRAALEPAANYFLFLETEAHASKLRRLISYERRAASRRRKAVRRLDYEMIEARRRKAGHLM
jgi:hypothetical protein